MSASALTNKPPAILAKTPLLAPPPGIQSNFVNPDNTGYGMIKVCSVFVALAMLAYVGRLYTRCIILRKPYWDDLTCGLGFALAIVNFASLVLGVEKGVDGRHQWDISVLQLMESASPKSNFIANLTWAWAQGLIKISFLLLYLTLFRPIDWLRYTIYISTSLIGAFYLAIGVVTTYLTSPRRGETWFIHFQSPQAHRMRSLSVGLCAVGLVIDLFIFALPVRAVIPLRMSIRRKFGVLATFATGLVTCAVAAANIGLRVTVLHTTDQMWDRPLVELMGKLELLLGIVTVCMAAMGPLFKHERSPFQKLGSSAGSGMSKLRSTKGAQQLSSERDEEMVSVSRENSGV